MCPVNCDRCREVFEQNEDNDELADLIEREHPNCECEACSVGIGSPGPVSDDEALHRIILSPRDYDPEEDKILERPFHKLFGNGLSVCRALASNEDVERLVAEGLVRNADEVEKQVFAICEVSAGEVRQMVVAAGRIFAIYDQTVAAADGRTPVPSHAAIFQRLPLPGTAERKKILRDFAGLLREKFEAGRLGLGGLRDGLFIELNVRAANGAFTRA